MKTRLWRTINQGGVVLPLVNVLLGCVLALMLGSSALILMIPKRKPHPGNDCRANLKQMDGATRTWAHDHAKLPTDGPGPDDLFGPDKYIREVPLCPQGGVYTLGMVRDRPRCNYSGHKI